tara:strand:- start:1884 stop:2138 length:255 start_codon:yes stop_codon:yes gene_type:complete
MSKISWTDLAKNYREQNEIVDEFDKWFTGPDFQEKTLPEELEKLERRAIEDNLAHHEGNRTKTANALGIGRTNLIKKLKKYSLL